MSTGQVNSRTKGKATKIGKMAAAIVRGFHCWGHANASFSQEGEDMILRRLFPEPVLGFYVDVGAHHPSRFSNTCHFYLRGWRGINIEPNPAVRSLFARRRPRDINLALGVSSTPGQLEYHLFDEPALNTFDPALASARSKEARYTEVGTQRIETRRLDAILAEYLPPGIGIDFLTVDAEGMDIDVLHSNDWSRFRPSCIVVEALEERFQFDNSTPVALFLFQQNYVLLAKTLNSQVFVDSRAVVARDWLRGADSR